MNKQTKITPAILQSTAREIAAQLQKARAYNGTAQRLALEQPTEATQKAADDAFADVERLERRLEALKAAAQDVDREAEKAERETIVSARREIADRARPLVTAFEATAMDLVDYLEGLKAKVEAFEATRAQAVSAIPHRGGSASIRIEEFAAFRDDLKIGDKDRTAIRGLTYHSGLGAWGIWPDVNKFVSTGDLRSSFKSGVARFLRRLDDLPDVED